MNLHNLHDNAKSLDYYDDQDLIPALAWEKYKFKDEELKKREKLWARDPEIAYRYAFGFLSGRFTLGEPAIAKDAVWSYLYADDVLRERFELGEPAIAKNGYYSYLYAKNLLKGPFKLGEPAIAKDPHSSTMYKRLF